VVAAETGAVVEQTRISAFSIPTDGPEADGTFEWNRTVLVTVEAMSNGLVGLGYTYADAATAKLIETTLSRIVLGHEVFATSAAYIKMQRAVRNLGHQGIAGMAISAVDAALWDLKARLLAVPLCDLLGRLRDQTPIYGSGGFTSYQLSRLEGQLRGWVEKGISRVKMKIGSDPKGDLQRVQHARDAIGESAELFVDANGAYARKQALAQAERFAELGVRWFEEPVSSDDRDGLSFLVSRAPAGMMIAAGEYGYDLPYFERMLEAQAVDALQADATRCGGVTGFMSVATLCDTHGIPLSAHCAPALHVHLGCAATRLIHLEYFHDHVRIEEQMFDGTVEARYGALTPDRTRPGNGLALREGCRSRELIASVTQRRGLA
jgi:L-alanine-DL-glutamate epimerase-like enolase superfamily enzyme